MLRQIIVNISHAKNESVPQSLAMRYLDVVTIQLLVVVKTSWSIEAAAISRKQKIIFWFSAHGTLHEGICQSSRNATQIE